MIQKLHFQKLKLFYTFALALLVPFCVQAQLSEALVNSEYRDVILKQLQKSVEQNEKTMHSRATEYLLGLPDGRKLYDESKMSIKTDLVSGITADGLRELNYRIMLNYSCYHFESTTDNYPTGKYLCEESNASMAIVEITRMIVDEIAAIAFKPGKQVDIRLKASTDITPVSQLQYKGEYGDFQYIAARYNGESVRISVSERSGINTNAQLAFLRAQGLRNNLERCSENLKHTTNSFSYETRSVSETGPQYRDVGIEILVHSAFDEEVVAMNEKLINDEFVDYNIPKAANGDNTKTYAFIIANERYGAPLPNVPYAYNDGETMQQYCVRTLGIPSRQVRIVEDATLNDIKEQGVRWMKDIAASQKGDCNFIIYFAGHGFTDYDYNPYLAPAGIDYKRIKAFKGKDEISTGDPLTKCDTKRLLNQCLRIDTLCSWFNRVPFKAMTIIVDASFDGNQRDGMPLITLKHSSKKAKALRIRNDIVVISAAAYDKTAYAFDEQHHGFFTYFLLKELKGCKGNITLGDLYDSVDSELQRESAIQGLLQAPTITIGGKLKETWHTLKISDL